MTPLPRRTSNDKKLRDFVKTKLAFNLVMSKSLSTDGDDL
jgi:hypothetical protein